MAKNKNYRELETVNSQRHELIPEEFPEGPYGSPMNFSLSHEWKPDQHVISKFSYEYRNFHEGISRQDEPFHPTHDDPNQNEEPL